MSESGEGWGGEGFREEEEVGIRSEGRRGQVYAEGKGGGWWEDEVNKEWRGGVGVGEQGGWRRSWRVIMMQEATGVQKGGTCDLQQ